MNEALLQYIWMAGLFDARDLKTTDGQEITILKRGLLNTDSGPDFSHARLRIGRTEWAGQVEIHLKPEDWYKHRHHLDKAYNNTILHVVYESGAPCMRADGSELPCLVLKERVAVRLLERYAELRQSGKWIACAPFLPLPDAFVFKQTIDRALVQRLERKSRQVHDWLKRSAGDWQTALYLALARSFGFSTNGEAFEQVAAHLPLKYLHKHREHTLQTEALVFGVAGFLCETEGDAYYMQLQNEWLFLQSKYQLKAIEKSNFKWMRMRPGNFPALRLAQFSVLALRCTTLFEEIRRIQTVADLRKAIVCEAPAYWKTHYHFSRTSSPHSTVLSADACDHILINALAPVLFVFGKETGDELSCEKALSVLQYTAPEKNHIVHAWQTLGISARNAYETQALLELKKQNCDAMACLNCPVGNAVLSST